MSAREAVLDAFEALLLEDGERAATLEAVAARAHVSKGGLLYHFGSKGALVDGLLTRLNSQAAADVAAMRSAPEGAAAHYIRSSVFEDTPFDRSIIAAVRLAQGSEEKARRAIQILRRQWLEAIDEDVGDRTVSAAILLMGDGLYYNASLTGTEAETPGEHGASGGDMPGVEELLQVVETLRNARRR